MDQIAPFTEAEGGSKIIVIVPSRGLDFERVRAVSLNQMSAFQGFSQSFGQSAVGNVAAPGVANSQDKGSMVAFNDPRVKRINSISVSWSDTTAAANLKPFKSARVIIVSDFITPADNIIIDPATSQPNKLVSTLNQRGDGQIIFDQTIIGSPFFFLSLAIPYEYIQERLTFIASPGLFTDTVSGYFVQPNLTVFGEYGDSLPNQFGAVWYPLGKPNPGLKSTKQM